MKRPPFSKEILHIKDIEGTCQKLAERMKSVVYHDLNRNGAVVGISGGIDSSVCFALSVKAFGSDKVLGIMLPEKDSNPDSEIMAKKLAGKFGVETITEVITGALDGYGCYARRDEAAKRAFPEYNPATHRMKIGIRQNPLKTSLPAAFSITIIDENGNEKSKLLSANDYLQIVAASNFKQRTRMSMLYYHAERLHYAVIGTPNKHESEQGFFVKYGDGGADVFPIVNYYKTQVYQMARYLGVPEDILNRTPTTDTYTAEQTQEEFFFQMPFETMDLIWYGFENGYPEEEVAEALGHETSGIKKVYTLFKRKQVTTDYLRKPPIHM
jgi:NAD+ synthase